MTGDKQLISGDSWRDSEAAKREKGGLGVQKSPFILIRYIAMINCLLRFTLKRTKETGKPKHVLFRSYKAIQACLIGRFHLDSTVT
jgi:hypothetical protein